MYDHFTIIRPISENVNSYYAPTIYPLEYEEIFKFIDSSAIKNIEPDRYGISNFGRVYDYVTSVFLPSIHHYNGYQYVCLEVDDKKFDYPIDRLVAFYFVPRKDNKCNILRHIDSDADNNFFTNLQWVRCIDQSYPTEIDRYCVTKRDIELICRLLEDRTLSQKDIAKITGISDKVSDGPAYVSRIYRGRSWLGVSKDYKLNNIRYFKRKSNKAKG